MVISPEPPKPSQPPLPSNPPIQGGLPGSGYINATTYKGYYTATKPTDIPAPAGWKYAGGVQMGIVGSMFGASPNAIISEVIFTREGAEQDVTPYVTPTIPGKGFAIEETRESLIWKQNREEQQRSNFRGKVTDLIIAPSVEYTPAQPDTKFGYDPATGKRVDEPAVKFGYDVRTGERLSPAQRMPILAPEIKASPPSQKDILAPYRDASGNVLVMRTGTRPGFESSNIFGDMFAPPQSATEREYLTFTPEEIAKIPKGSKNIQKYKEGQNIVISYEPYESAAPAAQRQREIDTFFGGKIQQVETWEGKPTGSAIIDVPKSAMGGLGKSVAYTGQFVLTGLNLGRTIIDAPKETITTTAMATPTAASKVPSGFVEMYSKPIEEKGFSRGIAEGIGLTAGFILSGKAIGKVTKVGYEGVKTGLGKAPEYGQKMFGTSFIPVQNIVTNIKNTPAAIASEMTGRNMFGTAYKPVENIKANIATIPAEIKNISPQQGFGRAMFGQSYGAVENIVANVKSTPSLISQELTGRNMFGTAYAPVKNIFENIIATPGIVVRAAVYPKKEKPLASERFQFPTDPQIDALSSMYKKQLSGELITRSELTTVFEPVFTNMGVDIKGINFEMRPPEWFKQRSGSEVKGGLYVSTTKTMYIRGGLTVRDYLDIVPHEVGHGITEEGFMSGTPSAKKFVRSEASAMQFSSAFLGEFNKLYTTKYEPYTIKDYSGASKIYREAIKVKENLVKIKPEYQSKKSKSVLANTRDITMDVSEKIMETVFADRWVIGKKYVPVENIVEPEILKGTMEFPTARKGTTALDMIKEFKESKYKLPGTEKETGGWHMSTHVFEPETQVMIGKSEAPGMFIAPSGSAHFWRLGSNEWKMFGFSDEPNPAGYWIQVKDITRTPKGTRTSMSRQNKFLMEQASREKAYITTGIETGTKMEKQAVIPPTEELNLKKVSSDFYTKYKGKKIPLMKYSVVESNAPFDMSMRDLNTILETESRRMSSYKNPVVSPEIVSRSSLISKSETKYRKFSKSASIISKKVSSRNILSPSQISKFIPSSYNQRLPSIITSDPSDFYGGGEAYKDLYSFKASQPSYVPSGAPITIPSVAPIPKYISEPKKRRRKQKTKKTYMRSPRKSPIMPLFIPESSDIFKL